ncbi:MAG: hypothetical protein ABSE97_08910 [Verrucomicrobiota bacterium]|jgi:hypothetical protein
MNKENTNPADAKLGALLRESRIAPALPPRFQESVWRRIEDAVAPSISTGSVSWLDALAALTLRPRLAFATVAALALAGVLLGTYQGTQVARHDAQVRYLAVVAPNPLR